MKHILAISILLGSLNGFAKCEDPVTYLIKGQQAPCSGYLLTPEMELMIRQDLVRLQENTNKIIKYEELLTLYDQQIKNYEKQNAVLTEQAELKTWEKVLYFALGAIAVGATIYVTR